jgi:hypothetical protein
MPRPTGSPITVTNGQPQREVERFQVFVSYDPDGTPRFRFQAFGVIRLRDFQGAIVWQGENVKRIVDLFDAAIPAGVRTSFAAILTRLDQTDDQVTP